MRRHIEVLAPAKVNLFLSVLGKRDDGYHDLFSLFVPVTLFDHLEIAAEKSNSQRIDLHMEGGVDLPLGEENLVYKAAKRLLDLSGERLKVEVKLRKEIPIGSGLGGGSSDAASTLLALNRLLHSPLSWKDLYVIGRSIGADVPPLLLRAPCLVTGIGDIFTPVSILPQIWFLVLCPDIQVSSAWAYGSIKTELTSPCIPYINRQVLGDIEGLAKTLRNDLEIVSCKAFPEIQCAKDLLLEVGAKGALMTGSGAGVFGIFQGEPQEELLNHLRSKGYRRVYKAQVFREEDWGVVKR